MTKKIDVFCKNDHLLFGRYRKVKSGYLLKCYIDEIGIDYVGVKNLDNNSGVFCPNCKIRVGRIGQIHGRPSVIINHGGVKRIKT